MAKDLKCEKCGVVVVRAEIGSLILSKAIVYCDDCHTLIKACLRLIVKDNVQKSPMSDIFKDIFPGMGSGGNGFFK